jgi:acetoacetyl-CoA synthetase
MKNVIKFNQKGDEGINTRLWTPKPEEIKRTNLYKFMNRLNLEQMDYNEFWQWSVENKEKFWSEVWDFCHVIGEKGDVILDNGDKMPGGEVRARFFPNARLNFAENLLKKKDQDKAIIFQRESQSPMDEEPVEYSFLELSQQVSRWQQALLDAGIKEGDRIAGYMPNIPETVIVMLAASSIGAVWASASPDFGTKGVVDRFGQIEPSILVSVDGYFYNGKEIDCLEKIEQVSQQIDSIKKIVIVSFVEKKFEGKGIMESAESFISSYLAKDIAYKRLPFDHPLFIMFSSGTTGVPKCIVHGAGGTLLQHLKEHQLQSNVSVGDRVFYFTTCGWMMWNWLVSALASNACLLLYDGSPFYPDGQVLWRFAERYKCSFFGTSAKYIDALKVNDIKPSEENDLSSIKVIASTGSPLVHESFDFIYEHVKQDVHLASISGGTDIISCFMLGNPLSPVFRGEIQGPGLAMAVDVFDDEGNSLGDDGGAGELVCTEPFPSMPVGFWNDPENEKYKSAYFDSFDNVWCHGDWVQKTSNQGFIIFGRSDATLNPGGVRIGTAEIYRQVEQVPEVIESIAVGQDWQGDVRVILFVVLKEGAELNDDLQKDIKTRIRHGASPRHVPAKIIAVNDIPRTKSGKITELAVRHVIHGRNVKNIEALANPESLELYKNIDALCS